MLEAGFFSVRQLQQAYDGGNSKCNVCGLSLNDHHLQPQPSPSPSPHLPLGVNWRLQHTVGRIRHVGNVSVSTSLGFEENKRNSIRFKNLLRHEKSLNGGLRIFCEVRQLSNHFYTRTVVTAYRDSTDEIFVCRGKQ